VRLSEILSRRVEDIDSQRMVIRTRQDKNDRYGRLSPDLVKLLREYWRAYREGPKNSAEQQHPGGQQLPTRLKSQSRPVDCV
jgi:integrase